MRRNKETISVSLKAYGEANSEAIIQCYIEVLEEIKQGDVETMCTKEAIIEGWERLTKNDLDDILKGVDDTEVNENQTKYMYDAETTKTKFEAK
ncbi:MAG: hypothetical protein GY786_01780 [Proteobacteria bacterium]|nr:hypothetical protein [Pseudomonadota bacterium]